MKGQMRSKYIFCAQISFISAISFVTPISVFIFPSLVVPANGSNFICAHRADLIYISNFFCNACFRVYFPPPLVVLAKWRYHFTERHSEETLDKKKP